MTELVIDDAEQLTDDMGCVFTYAAIRERMNGEPWTMSLTDSVEITAVIECVNQGIDSYLQACNMPSRGDEYSGGARGFTATSDGPQWKKGEFVTITQTLECTVSIESLPVLLRRLFEMECDLAATILDIIWNSWD